VQLVQRLTFFSEADLTLDLIDINYWQLIRAVGAGVDLDYIIYGANGAEFERGTGQLAVGGGFSRATVIDSSAAGAKVVFSYGTHYITIWQDLNTGSGGGVPTTYDTFTAASQSKSSPASPAVGDLWWTINPDATYTASTLNGTAGATLDGHATLTFDGEFALLWRYISAGVWFCLSNKTGLLG
jgi:hypothetical protein